MEDLELLTVLLENRGEQLNLAVAVESYVQLVSQGYRQISYSLRTPLGSPYPCSKSTESEGERGYLCRASLDCSARSNLIDCRSMLIRVTRQGEPWRARSGIPEYCRLLDTRSMAAQVLQMQKRNEARAHWLSLPPLPQPKTMMPAKRPALTIVRRRPQPCQI